VALDDLTDRVAWLYAETARQIKARNPTPLSSCPSQTSTVLAHNLETVPRIFKPVRPAFRYHARWRC
jgi:lipoic acid synthetase